MSQIDQNVTKKGKYLTPFQRKQLQKSLQDPNLNELYRQRLQIMLMADEGKTQSQICRALNCSAATVRHWTLFARSGEAHHWQETPLGRPKAVTEEYCLRLQELVSQSPRDVNVPNKPYQYHHARWTAKRLSQHLTQEFGIELSDRHINRLLKNMGLSTRTQTTKPEESELQISKTGIVIKTLEVDAIPESPQFWQFNAIKIS